MLHRSLSNRHFITFWRGKFLEMSWTFLSMWWNVRGAGVGGYLRWTGGLWTLVWEVWYASLIVTSKHMTYHRCEYAGISTHQGEMVHSLNSAPHDNKKTLTDYVSSTIFIISDNSWYLILWCYHQIVHWRQFALVTISHMLVYHS